MKSTALFLFGGSAARSIPLEIGPERVHIEQPSDSCSVWNKAKKQCPVCCACWETHCIRAIPHCKVPPSHSTKPKPDGKPPRQVGTDEGARFPLLSTTEFSKMKLRFGTPRHCFVPCQNPVQMPGDKTVLCVHRSVSPRVRRRCWSQQLAPPLHRHGVPSDEDAFEQR